MRTLFLFAVVCAALLFSVNDAQAFGRRCGGEGRGLFPNRPRPLANLFGVREAAPSGCSSGSCGQAPAASAPTYAAGPTGSGVTCSNGVCRVSEQPSRGRVILVP